MTRDLTLSLSGKTAIVTGAAGGIGRKTVETLVAHGVNVIAEDIRPEVEELATAERIVPIVGDVSQEPTARRAVGLALQQFGSLDILINNAGRTLVKPLVDTSAGEWDDIMATNARGTFLHSREALRVMIARGGGCIVNVASMVSVVGMAQVAAYAASKGAIAQLTKVIAVEYGRHGIRANAVAPGMIATGILDGMVSDSRATLAAYGPLHPIGRIGQPQEIADVIAYLASPRASFITGAIVMADGGFTAI